MREAAGPVAADVAAQPEGTFRAEYGRIVATLARVLADIDLAEDSAAEAFAIACRTWPERGAPPNPGGWLVTTARNRAARGAARAGWDRAATAQEFSSSATLTENAAERAHLTRRAAQM